MILFFKIVKKCCLPVWKYQVKGKIPDILLMTENFIVLLMIIIQEIGFREVCPKSKTLIVQMYPINLSFFWDNSQFVNYYVHHCYVSKID